MKSEHRHELKTNALADWLAHSPEWLKENGRVIAGAAAVIVIVIAVYYWNAYNRSVRIPQQHLRLTSLISQAGATKMQIVRSNMEDNEVFNTGNSLAQTAQDLETFAQGAGRTPMAATAYLEQAKAIRADAHLNSPNLTNDDLQQQIQRAQESYRLAQSLAGRNISLRASAEYGLGLCAEELRDFSTAQKIYETILNNEELSGTAAQTAAQYRLSILPSVQAPLAFLPAPPTPELPIAAPTETTTSPDLVNEALAPILNMDANGS